MSISNSLSNALSGLNAASRQTEIVSSNIANALTDGYGTRSLELSSASIGGRGAGVQVGAVERSVDRGILADRRLADAEMGGFGYLASTMGRVEEVVGQAGSTDSISGRIVALEASLIDAAADPSSGIRLSNVANRLDNVAEGLNDASGAIQDLRSNADRSIANQVEQLNTALLQVERLNTDIVRSNGSGGDPSGLFDQRQRVIDQIAEMVPVREFDREGGRVALMTPAGEMLIDGKAKSFGFTSNAIITSDMTLASGGLAGITLEGAPIAVDGIGKLAGGSLGAAFQARDVELVAAQVGLDDIAADLISRFQDPGVDPTLGVADAGLLTDNGVPFNAINTPGLAARISMNALVDVTQGGIVTNLRDGLNAVAPGPSGDASLLQSLSAALKSPQVIAGSPLQQSAAARASAFEAEAGNSRLNFDSELTFANARWSSLREAEAAGGVDTDFEMQMLLRAEQAYAANARVIQAVEIMMQRLMEL